MLGLEGVGSAWGEVVVSCRQRGWVGSGFGVRGVGFRRVGSDQYWGPRVRVRRGG